MTTPPPSSKPARRKALKWFCAKHQLNHGWKYTSCRPPKGSMWSSDNPPKPAKDWEADWIKALMLAHGKDEGGTWATFYVKDLDGLINDWITKALAQDHANMERKLKKAKIIFGVREGNGFKEMSLSDVRAILRKRV